MPLPSLAITGLRATLATGIEDFAYTVTKAQLLQGFSTVAGRTLSVVGLTADHGSVVQSPDGIWTIKPEANYTGVVTLSYGVSDGVATLAATLGLTLVAVNDAPTLTGIPAALAVGSEDTTYTLTKAQLLQGFTDPDGDALSVTGLMANHGSLVQNANGSWTFTPTANYNGVVTLSYGVSDGKAVTMASQSFTLAAVNDGPPVLTGAKATLPAGSEDTAYTLTRAQLLQGFTDVDGDALLVTGLVADHGSAVQNPDGSWTITPAPNYNGTVRLSYGVSDGMATKAALQSFTLAAVNDAAVLTGAPATLAAGTEDTAYTVTKAQLLQGFTDVDGDALAVTGLTADHGSVVQNASGAWTITPQANYTGVVTLSYGVSDGKATTGATLGFTLAAINDAAALTGAKATLPTGAEDMAYAVTKAQLLQGFTDADGDLLSVTGLTANHGSVVQNANGSWTITPEANYNGAVTLSYGVSDGAVITTASQSFTLAAVNDAAVLTGTPAALLEGTEDTAYTVTKAQLLQGFSDVDGDALSVTSLTANHGDAVKNASGGWTITPEMNYTGVVTLSYGVSDGKAATMASQSITLAAVNDAPALSGMPAALAPGTEDMVYTVTKAQLLQGFTDVDGDALSVTALAANHGSAVRNADGSWTITPEANYTGAVALSYGVSDGKATTTASQNLTLAAVNDGTPMLSGAKATLATGTEDMAYTVTKAQLLQGFTDVDGDVLSVTGLTANHGSTAQNANGSWTITPEANYNGAVTLSYGVSDGTATTAATLGFALAAVNDAAALTGAPAALAAGTEDTAYTVTKAQLLQGFTDVDGDALSITVLSANHGSAVRNADGSWTITPAANYNGAMTLSYGVNDGKATTAATKTLSLAPVNDGAPVLTGAKATLATGSEDTPYTVTATQLLQGFTDVDGDALSVTGLTANHGSVVQNASGGWTITPQANYSGAVMLSYGVSDGTATTAATQGFTLAAVNDAAALTGAPDTLAAGTEDTVYTVTKAQLLQGFTDVDGDALSVTGLSVNHGSAVQNASGGWIITPQANYNGVVTLSYGVSDGKATTPVTQGFTLAPVNDGPPVLTGMKAMLFSGTEDTAYTVTKAQLLQGFTDVDGDALSVTDFTVNNGSAVQNANGSWTITPQANYAGAVMLSYGVSDGTATTAATLSFTLAAVNDAPALTGAKATLAAGTEDTAYTVTKALLLQGFTDVDGDVLSIFNLMANHGSLVQNANGNWTFTPTANYNGAVTLSYGVSDGKAITMTSQSFTLAAVNDGPPALTGVKATLFPGTEDMAYTVTKARLLQGFTDVDGDTLSVTGLTANHGTAVQNADGSWTITPAADYTGVVTLSYGVSDGTATTAATLNFTLAAVNDAAVLTGAKATLDTGTEDTAYTVTKAQLLQGFTDAEGDALSVTGLTANHGSVVQNANGGWTITPEANYNGVVTLSYGVSDVKTTTTALQTFTLAAVNDGPPILTGAKATPAAGIEDTAYTVTKAQLLQGFTDVDGDPLAVLNLTADHGATVENANGSWTITPAANYNGVVTLSYGVSDGTAITTATLSFTLAAVNDGPVLTGAPATLAAGTEDTAYTVTKAQLLQGFTDADGDALSVTGLMADHGSVVQNAGGGWAITPQANYTGAVALSYGVSDGKAAMAATLGFTLAAVNDVPTLAGTPATLAAGTEDKPYTVTKAQLLQGFTDADGDALGVTGLTADHGSAVQNADGSWTIAPATDYNGAVSLNYGVSDGKVATVATLGFTLAAVNDGAPVLTGTPVTLALGSEDTAYTLTKAQLLQGFTDVDGDVLSVSGLTANHGSVVQNANGSWTITPAANYNGTVTLSYGVSDGMVTTAATLGFTLATVNDGPPVLTGAKATLVAGTEDTAYTVTKAQLLQGFTDVDGDALSVTTLTASHGSAVQNPDGSWTITPAANYNGAVALSYGVSDGTAITAAALNFSLTTVNDAAALSGAKATLAVGVEDTGYTVTKAQLLQGFTDAESNALSVLNLTTDHGSTLQNADGSWTITPEADYNGVVTLSYGVSDGTAITAATLGFTLASVNDAPKVTSSQATLAAGTEDMAYTVTEAQLLQGFTDADGETLSVTGLAAVHGNAVQNADGSWTITPEVNYSGTVTLSYGVSDGSITTDATHSVTLIAVNDAPTTSAVTLTPIAQDNGARVITQADLLGNASDVENDTLMVSDLVIAYGTGTVTANEDGTWTYTPTGDDDTPVSMRYTITDNGTTNGEPAYETVAGTAMLDLLASSLSPTPGADLYQI